MTTGKKYLSRLPFTFRGEYLSRSCCAGLSTWLAGPPVSLRVVTVGERPPVASSRGLAPPPATRNAAGSRSSWGSWAQHLAKDAGFLLRSFDLGFSRVFSTRSSHRAGTQQGPGAHGAQGHSAWQKM